MNSQRRFYKAIPVLVGACKTELRGACNVLERTQFRPISTCSTSAQNKEGLSPVNLPKESEVWVMPSNGLQNHIPHGCVLEPFAITSILRHDFRKHERKMRKFSTLTQCLLAKKAQKTKSKTKKLALNEEEAEGIVDLKNLKQKMEDVLEEMSEELAAKVPLRITSGFLDNIVVDTGKGKKTPLYELAQVKTNSESFSIEVQSNFPNATKLVAAAISDTGFNMQPTIKGSTITVPIPLASSDHRSSLEKLSKSIANKAKDALRKVRQRGMVEIRNNKEGQSKDLIHRVENQVQQLTDHYNGKVDLTYDKKVKEINK